MISWSSNPSRSSGRSIRLQASLSVSTVKSSTGKVFSQCFELNPENLASEWI